MECFFYFAFVFLLDPFGCYVQINKQALTLMVTVSLACYYYHPTSRPASIPPHLLLLPPRPARIPPGRHLFQLPPPSPRPASIPPRLLLFLPPPHRLLVSTLAAYYIYYNPPPRQLLLPPRRIPHPPRLLLLPHPPTC